VVSAGDKDGWERQGEGHLMLLGAVAVAGQGNKPPWSMLWGERALSLADGMIMP